MGTNVPRGRQRRRVGGDMFRGLSFPTIAASGPHGAITHYSATEESSRCAFKLEVYEALNGLELLVFRALSY